VHVAFVSHCELQRWQVPLGAVYASTSPHGTQCARAAGDARSNTDVGNSGTWMVPFVHACAQSPLANRIPEHLSHWLGAGPTQPPDAWHSDEHGVHVTGVVLDRK
jgi:hypothetical protein